jgi:hypothetical protein
MSESIVAIAVGILLGAGLVMLYLAYRIKLVMNTLDQHIHAAIKNVSDSFICIVVEKDNDTYYCYRKEDHQFVCQGKDINAILEAFKIAYPDRVAVIANNTDPEIIKEFEELVSK